MKRKDFNKLVQLGVSDCSVSKESFNELKKEYTDRTSGWSKITAYDFTSGTQTITAFGIWHYDLL